MDQNKAKVQELVHLIEDSISRLENSVDCLDNSVIRLVNLFDDKKEDENE